MRITFNASPVDLQKATLWITIHITSAFACACLPLFKPFVVKVVEGSNFITGYTRSLLSSSRFSRGRGDISTGQSNGYVQRIDGDGSSADDSYRMKQYTSRTSLRLDPIESDYQVGVHGQQIGDSGNEIQHPKAIKVKSEYVVI